MRLGLVNVRPSERYVRVGRLPKPPKEWPGITDIAVADAMVLAMANSDRVAVCRVFRPSSSCF